MPIAMFLSIMTMMYLGVMAFAESPYQKAKENLSSAATSMALYHTLAVRQCTKPNTCVPGQIKVVNSPNSIVDISGLSSKFAAYTDGTVILTMLTPSFSQHISGEVSAFNNALNVQTYDSVLAGPYVPTESAVISDEAHKVIRLADGTHKLESGMLTVRLRSVPPSIGGVTLVAGQPIIVTPIY